MFCVLSQKIINIILKNNVRILNMLKQMILSKELKNGIEILVDKAVFKLWIKTAKNVVWINNSKPLSLPKFWCYFLVPWTIYYEMYWWVLLILR